VVGWVDVRVQVFAALASVGANAIAANRATIVTNVAPREMPAMRRLRVCAASPAGLTATADESLFCVGMAARGSYWDRFGSGWAARTGRIK
jgi:hypothetical protein